MGDAAERTALTTWRAPLTEPPDLEDVFSRFVDPVFRFLYSHVGNREDAEDLTSEVFLKAAKQLDRARSEASIAKWLFTVARTVLADHWRKYYRSGVRVPLEDDRVGVVPTLEPDPPTSDSNSRLVEEVLAGLPERYRTVLELRFLRGYSISETALAMGITPENAKVIQHRALGKAANLSGGRL